MKRIAVVGSSGGNLYNLGGKDPEKMIEEIKVQLDSAGMNLEDVEFVGAKTSMDNKNDNVLASLFYLENGVLLSSEEKKLPEINKDALEYDKKLAEKIKEGIIDGLIVMSCDPDGINNSAILAAAEKKIPIVGTGGTSMATISAMGANVISSSGTTGTTNRTRAVAAVTSLSKFWKIKYSPVIGSGKRDGVMEDKGVFSRINIRGVMMAAIP